MANDEYRYREYLKYILTLMRDNERELGTDFCNQYANYIRSDRGQRSFLSGMDNRISRLVPPNQNITNDALHKACVWILRDARQKAMSQRSTGLFGGSGLDSGFGTNTSGSFSGSVGAPTDIMDPDFATIPQQPSSVPITPVQEPIPQNTSTTTFTPQPPTAENHVMKHHDGHSPYFNLTNEDMSKATHVDLSNAAFERKRILNSVFSGVKHGIQMTYANTPPCVILSTNCRVPVSDPIIFDKWIREIFTSDVIGLFWAVSVDYERLYTLPIPVEDFRALSQEIKRRADEEGYTPDLVVKVLKTCSQEAYEAVSTYLVTEFNKVVSRFMRSTKNPDQGITLSCLNGIGDFFRNPPVCAPTENPLGISKFALITNKFFQSIFSLENAPLNSDRLTAQNYAAYLHNDAVDMWDPISKITKYGVPFLKDDEEKAWLERVNQNLTILKRKEKVLVTNVASPACVTSVGIGGRLNPNYSGDSRILHSLTRVVNYQASDRVSGIIAAPVARSGTSVVTMFSLGNPLEDPEENKSVYLYRVANL